MQECYILYKICASPDYGQNNIVLPGINEASLLILYSTSRIVFTSYSKHTEAWRDGFSSLTQGDSVMKWVELWMSCSFENSHTCGQQEHVWQGSVFSHR